jgi:capsular polysaccharide transport system permease protein
MSQEAQTAPVPGTPTNERPVTDLRPRAAALPSSAADKVRENRRRRTRNLLSKIGVFVLLPTVAAAIYFGFFASDRYESVSLFTINASDARPSLSAMESLIGLAGAAPATRDTLAVRDFVLSREMLADLDQSEDFIAHYKSRSADFWSRLAADASFEDAFSYYKDIVLVAFDSNSGVLTLKVQAYSADQALKFSRRILKRSEDMVNHLAEKAREDQITFAKVELEKAEKRLSGARQHLMEVQQERGEFNPEATAAAAMSIRTTLEGELAKARAELAALKSYMADDAPQVIAASERVRSLAGQAAGESQRLVSSKGEKGLNADLVLFEKVAVEKEFATRAYQSALTTLELARTDAARQHRYLATIAQPSLADEAQYPRRYLGTLTVFLACFLGFGIFSLLAATIKEHARL